MVLKHVDLYQYFDLILGGDSIKNGKPAPDIIFEALNHLNLKIEDVLFVGDTIWDKRAAEAAKVKFIGYDIDAETKINDLIKLKELV